MIIISVPTSPPQPEKYKTSDNKTHLPPTGSADPEPGYGTLPGGDAYAHHEKPPGLFWQKAPDP